MKNRILIVDDEPIICSSLKFLLPTLVDADVDTAHTVEEATRLWEEHSYTLLIVDHMLGDSLDGIQLIEKFRQSIPTIPAVVHSGFLSPELQKKVKTMQNTHLVEKPIDIDRFKQVIESLLN